VVSGIAYLPLFITMQAAAFAFGLYHSWKQQQEISTIEDVSIAEKIKKKINSTKNRDVEIFAIASIAALFAIFFAGDAYLIQIYSLLSLFIGLYVFNTYISKKLGDGSFMLATIGFLAFVTIFNLGAGNAISDQRSRSEVLIIRTATKTVSASAARVFPDSILYFENGIPTFISSQNVLEITYRKPRMDTRGRGFCENFGLCLRNSRPEVDKEAKY
ncbi:MAG: hypothetical protein KF899_15615, partial [Parvibaculum sp.]|nr:hypothetical protein [Parvibaculum sp.]